MRKIALTLGALGLLVTAGVAYADTPSAATGTAVQTTTTTQAPQTAQQMVLQVGAAGRVLLRGTIDSVSATSITVKSWGGDWTVNVPTTASVLPQGVVLSEFKTGDFVGVQGTVNSSANWTVDATLVRDWTARQVLTQQIKANTQAVQQAMAGAPRTIQGALSNWNATAQTFTLTTTNGTAYSVSLTASPILLTNNRATLSFSQVNNGDTVRVYGTVAGSAITASIFRDVTVK